MAEPLSARRGLLGALALVVVLVVVLFIGRGAPTNSSPSARAAALDSQIKCPSCADLSVAQSTSSSALAVRQQISAMVAEGQSDQQIENSLVERYGPTILLRPPTHGLTALVWILPALGAVVAAGVLGTFFVRRARDLDALKQAAA
jgi:cytochrome c-type biogenesis protein CcmH/NrfF